MVAGQRRVKAATMNQEAPYPAGKEAAVAAAATSIDRVEEDEVGYSSITKSGKNGAALTEHSYIRVIKYVSAAVADDFSLLKDLKFFLNVFDSTVVKKLIFLTLHSTKVYSNLAQKVLKIQHNEFERAVSSLSELGVFEQAVAADPASDPFLRWAKTYSPNLSVKRIKLYRLSRDFASLFNSMEDKLEACFDREVADEIKHFRFAIRRTHRDILREKKVRAGEQKKLHEALSKNIRAREVGSCCLCQVLLYEVEASRANPAGVINYREHKGALYCHACYRKLLQGHGR